MFLKDVMPYYYHAKFGGDLTTNKGETERGGTMCPPWLYGSKIPQPE